MGTSDTQTLTNKTLSDNVKAGTNFIITPSPTATTSWKGANLITVPSQLPMQRAKLKVYPVTVVNLLGKYGDFEMDSNSDGLADGWGKTYADTNVELSPDKVVIGNKSQHMWINTGASSLYAELFINAGIQNNVTYFASLWAYLTRTPYFPQFMLPGSPFMWATMSGSMVPNRFNKHFASFTPTTANGIFHFYYSMPDSNERFDVWVDGLMLVNLTRMGVLPPPLKEYFNNVPSTWADLATASNITAIDGKVQSGNAWLNDLLPYVNGVGTLGYAWGA